MILVWVIFSLMLFLLEPLVLRRWFHKHAAERPHRVLGWIQRMHWILLSLSLLTIAGAVAGSHGWHWF